MFQSNVKVFIKENIDNLEKNCHKIFRNVIYINTEKKFTE